MLLSRALVGSVVLFVSSGASAQQESHCNPRVDPPTYDTIRLARPLRLLRNLSGSFATALRRRQIRMFLLELRQRYAKGKSSIGSTRAQERRQGLRVRLS
jgi:hypothetical protein